MPIYEYRCPDCGHEFDALQKVSDAPLTDCPSCAGTGLKKLISRTSFALKGGGSSSSSGGGASSGGSAASSSSSSSSSSGSGGGSAKSE